MIIFVDTGVLGLLSSPNQRKEVINSQEWLYFWLSKGVNIISSDICDYEVRRGTLLTANSQLKEKGIKKLDDLHDLIDFIPVNLIILKYSAELWAKTRRLGLPTTSNRIILRILLGDC